MREPEMKRISVNLIELKEATKPYELCLVWIQSQEIKDAKHLGPMMSLTGALPFGRQRKLGHARGPEYHRKLM